MLTCVLLLFITIFITNLHYSFIFQKHLLKFFFQYFFSWGLLLLPWVTQSLGLSLPSSSVPPVERLLRSPVPSICHYCTVSQGTTDFRWPHKVACTLTEWVDTWLRSCPGHSALWLQVSICLVNVYMFNSFCFLFFFYFMHALYFFIFKVLKFYFSFTVDIRHYFVLVSGVQHRWETVIHFTSGLPRISSTHLAPYIIIIILLTVFPMLYCISLWLFCNCQFVLLNPFTFFHPVHQLPLSYGNYRSVHCFCEFVSI